jgi:hypothetical protein
LHHRLFWLASAVVALLAASCTPTSPTSDGSPPATPALTLRAGAPAPAVVDGAWADKKGCCFSFTAPENWVPAQVPTGMATVDPQISTFTTYGATYIELHGPAVLTGVRLTAPVILDIQRGAALTARPGGIAACSTQPYHGADLRVQGEVAGDVTICGLSDVLSGNGVITGNVVQRGGTIRAGADPRSPMLKITGDYRADGGTLVPNVAYGTGLTVDGTATLNNTSVMIFYGQQMGASRIKVLSARHISGRFKDVTVTRVLPGYSFGFTVDYTETDVTVTVHFNQPTGP